MNKLADAVPLDIREKPSPVNTGVTYQMQDWPIVTSTQGNLLSMEVPREPPTQLRSFYYLHSITFSWIRGFSQILSHQLYHNRIHWKTSITSVLYKTILSCTIILLLQGKQKALISIWYNKQLYSNNKNCSITIINILSFYATNIDNINSDQVLYEASWYTICIYLSKKCDEKMLHIYIWY